MSAPPRAIVLAAGRGERLRPLTSSIPKPLLAVGGKPLIVYHLEKLAAAGIREVAVNVSWLGARLIAELGTGAAFGVSIRWFDEGPEPLEVAGGIRNALEFLGPAPFVVVNGDIYTDYVLPPPMPGPGRLAHLVLVPNPAEQPRGNFGLECDEVRLEGPQRYTYAGIASFRSQLFAPLAPGRAPLKPLLDAATLAGRITGEVHRGEWTDVGTPERLVLLEARVVGHRPEA